MTAKHVSGSSGEIIMCFIVMQFFVASCALDMRGMETTTGCEPALEATLGDVFQGRLDEPP
jgi:hypothetical protein